MSRPEDGSPVRRWAAREPRERVAGFTPRNILRWIYLGRLVLTLGILLGALVVWGEAQPEQTFLSTVAFLVALFVTAGSAWYTEFLDREPGRNFHAAQVAFDALLVTAVVHITGGGESTFAWLYILVISEGALLLPIAGGVLISALASILYFSVIVWLHADTLTGAVWLQIVLFTLVAILTGILGDRLRRTGTALGEMQSELRRLRLDTSEILASISTGVVTVDEKGRLLYMNPAGEALLGIDIAEWEGASAVEALRNRAPALAAKLGEALTKGISLYRLRADAVRDGEELVFGVSIFVRDEPDEPRSVTAIFQDITDLERMAILNRRTERLEAVAELSAAMAHEIKNPLSSIRSAVEQFTSPNLTQQDREALTRMVVRESDRLSRLLSDFLDFSRVRVDRVEEVSINELARDCVALVGQHPATEGGEVRIHSELPDQEILATVDPDLIHRALFNLLLNAVQHSPAGGTVTLRLEGVPGTPLPEDVEIKNPILLSIRDQGPGIDPDEVNRIFDPFFTTRDGGTGLGLAVVYRTVEAHRGVILVEVPDGGGADFQIYLPSGFPTRESGAPAALEAGRER
ncbi:MAG: PAS domain S-box protein [Gemmatimonadales bacterium]|nr:MAG: PAS domain S-box protein [Gemmatimonadales bacterium]